MREILDARAPRLDQAIRELVTRGASRLVVRSDGRVVFLRPSEIEWVEALGNYVKIHRGGERLIVRQSLASIEERLQHHGFVRIERSILVNTEHVAEVRRE